MSKSNLVGRSINIILITICILSTLSIFLADEIIEKIYSVFLISFIIGYIKFIKK